MQEVATKVRENIKKDYTTTNGQFFVHGVTLNGVEHEYHSKSQQCTKIKEGQMVYYNVSEDARGNKKIKLVTPAPGAVTTPPSPFNGIQGPVDNKTDIWLSLFASICTLKSGSNITLEQIIEATDKTAEKIAQR